MEQKNWLIVNLLQNTFFSSEIVDEFKMKYKSLKEWKGVVILLRLGSGGNGFPFQQFLN